MNLKKCFIEDIKKKKELSSLNDNFVSWIVEDYFSRNKGLILLIEHPKIKRSKEFKQSLKELRRVLHDIYGVFQLKGNREKLLSQLKNKANEEEFIRIHEKILKTHRSTKERVNDYDFIYSKIIDKNTESILDLSSGLNVFSFPWMNLKKVNYIATEVSEKDCNFLNEYFKVMKKFGLRGKAVTVNLLEKRKFPKADLVLMLKLLDTLETLKPNISREILNELKYKKLVVSFPTRTLSGKALSKKRLKWFEKIVKKYETFEIENEIFYIIKEALHINKP